MLSPEQLCFIFQLYNEKYPPPAPSLVKKVGVSPCPDSVCSALAFGAFIILATFIRSYNRCFKQLTIL